MIGQLRWVSRQRTATEGRLYNVNRRGWHESQRQIEEAEFERATSFGRGNGSRIALLNVGRRLRE